MPARVFISCGQAIEEERNVSNELEQWFRSEGYDPYVAIQVQTIGDLNAGIIEALKASDYVFINFQRDKIVAGKDEFTAVLFTRTKSSQLRTPSDSSTSFSSITKTFRIRAFKSSSSPTSRNLKMELTYCRS